MSTKTVLAGAVDRIRDETISKFIRMGLSCQNLVTK